ncbi:MAG TPA: nitroreductase family deazaflavin-dependent oxidoreductase [Candidatus Dormibacteraeota bacterium]
MKANAHNLKTIEEFQAKKGRGIGIFGDHILLMTAKGAKSGDAITTPLVYGRDGKDYLIVASKGGAPDNPRWFGNLKANPEVEIQVGNGQTIETTKARAQPVESGPERDRLFQEMAKIWPDYLNYQKRTERTIPVVRLKPVSR